MFSCLLAMRFSFSGMPNIQSVSAIIFASKQALKVHSTSKTDPQAHALISFTERESMMMIQATPTASGKRSV